MATQGKCDICGIRWTWKEDKIPLRYKRCQKCGGVLKPTTHLMKSYRTIDMKGDGRKARQRDMS